MFTQLGNLYNQVLVSNNLGGIALKQSRFEAALSYYQRAIRLLQQTGGSLWVFGALHMNIGNVFIRLNQLDEAFKNLETSRDYMDRAGVRDFLPELYGLFAEAAWLEGNLDAAANYGKESLELARELNVPREYGHNLRIMGEISYSHGHFEEAAEFFQKSYEVLVETGDDYESAKTKLSWAHLLADLKQWQGAYQASKDSEGVFARLGNQYDLTDAQVLLFFIETKQSES
jgi:tetratricopeptide (TPR) repeat protein